MRSGRGARYGSEQDCFSSKLLAISGVAPCQSQRGYFQLGNKPCPRIASTHRERGLRTRNALRCDRRLPSSKRAVSIFQLWCTLYLCMSRSTCIEPTLGSRRATWLRKRRRQRRRPARRKRSSLRRHTVPSLRHIKGRARLCHREPILPRFDVVQ